MQSHTKDSVCQYGNLSPPECDLCITAEIEELHFLHFGTFPIPELAKVFPVAMATVVLTSV